MRVLGVLLFLGGCAATAVCVAQAYAQGRPRDLLFALLAPIAALLAITGLILAFVPRFFG